MTKKGSEMNGRETAYNFVRQVGLDLEVLGLEETQVSLDIEMYTEGNTVTLDYEIETLDWVEDYIEEGHVSHTDSYSFTSDEGLVPDREQIKEFLSDNFFDTPLRLDDEVIRESLSPEYDAF